MKKEKRKVSIIAQVATLFLIGVLVTGALTYLSETRLYDNSVKRQTELRAAQIAEEVRQTIMEYPAYTWLIRYWYENSGTLQIEYDAAFSEQTQTAEKCRIFSSRHPELQLRYMNAAQCRALPEEDQHLYAEIAYSWLITRINEIKQANHVDYLFCVISEEPFERQFFLISAADPGAVRGTSYEEVYPLGNTVSVSGSQVSAMREAIRSDSHLADAGNYVDYYAMLYSFDEHSVLIGLTYDLSALRADIDMQTRSGATLAILHQIVLSVLCLVMIFFILLLPLRKVQAYIREYKKEKNSEAVIGGLEQIRSRNEIGYLARDVSEMAREIDLHMENIRNITAEKERIGTELELGARIQAAMLPSVFPPFPDRGEFDLYASMDPAKEVGGDFYDFFLLDDDHLAAVIADVSGKGVPAALFMMISKILVKIYAASDPSPAKVLETLNRQICENSHEDMFVTVWLGVLEISTGKLTAANAGHEYPVLKQPDGGFALVRDKHGLVVGAMDGIRYKEYELQLRPGAKLFVYTDGVPEATNAENRMFGTERMLAALNEEPEAAPERLLERVRSAVNDFVKDAEQFDDMTMLCLEYRGPAAEDKDA